MPDSVIVVQPITPQNHLIDVRARNERDLGTMITDDHGQADLSIDDYIGTVRG
jgi:hypothetical protein